MAKTRTIFQPDKFTGTIIKSYQNSPFSESISNFVNECITDTFTPRNESLRIIFKRIYELIQRDDEVSTDEIQNALASSVEALKDYPISESYTLSQILMHFTCGKGFYQKYDYIMLVDDHSDAILHYLNATLKTVDPNYNMGKRELGERAATIFEHWEELCGYENIYIALATIIRLEKMYINLDVFRALCFIRQLDIDISRTPAEKKGKIFPTNITNAQQIQALRYEINVYQCDNGYAALSGDHGFQNMPEDFRKYERKWLNDSKYSIPENNEDDALEILRQTEATGRRLLKEIASRKQKF